MSGLDTVDITELAEEFGKDFVSRYTALAMEGLLKKATWLASGGNFLVPLITEIVEEVIKYIGYQGGLIMYTFNTTVFTTDQGSDYIKQKEKMRAIPEDISDEDWIKEELESNRLFGNLWNYRK